MSIKAISGKLNPNQSQSTKPKKNKVAEIMAKISNNITPQLTEAYINRGSIRRKQGDFDGALTDYNKTLEIDTRSYSAYFNLGTGTIGYLSVFNIYSYKTICPRVHTNLILVC